MSEGRGRKKGVVFALLAACLFGASTPLAKVLLPKVEPALMAGLLYPGSVIGLGAYSLLRSGTIGFGLASALMATGVGLHLTERHGHEHGHEPLEHDHSHHHDEHHEHAHGPNDSPGQPHSHWHRHSDLTHSHPHYPDIHSRL